MTVKLTPVQRTDPGDIGIVQATQRLHREALPKVRGNALAWRNGLAGLLAGYALNLGEGDLVRLDGTTSALPLVGELYRAALLRGAHPYANTKIEGLDRILLEEGSDAQIQFISSIELAEVEALDALVTIWSEENTRALTRVDTDKQARMLGARRGQRASRRDHGVRADLRVRARRSRGAAACARVSRRARDGPRALRRARARLCGAAARCPGARGAGRSGAYPRRRRGRPRGARAPRATSRPRGSRSASRPGRARPPRHRPQSRG